MNFRHISFVIVLTLLLVISSALPVHAQTLPVVHAVLFYSPSCGHCHYVITETLLPLLEKYGEQFQIVGVDVTNPTGQTLFMSALQKFGLEGGGVPFLVIGNAYLVGSVDIPEQLPGLIEYHLAQGGVDWSDIPGFREALSQSAEASAPTATNGDEPSANVPIQPTVDGATADGQPQENVQPATPEAAPTSPALALPGETPGQLLTDEQKPSWRDNFLRDPAGNTLSIIVLIGMLGALFWTGKLFLMPTTSSLKRNWIVGIPILCLIGFFVAGYLSYVETSQVMAVCGPVGDCNTVQQSDYARLFGVLPIGILGLVGYTFIAIAWLIVRFASNRLANLAAISLFLLTLSGTLFSIYLTFLEPFVIGATCAWCLTSAVLMTALMLITVTPAKAAFSGLAKN
jgi:uncharacterized membrane protein/thiol-disulfide isomerase/thioredoxin